jgi:VIT family
MPQTPHVERHFTGSATVRDLVIGMSDGLTVPFALAASLSGAVDDTRIIVTAGLAEIAAGSIAISASVGITLLALAIFGYVKGHFTGAQLPANGIDRRIGRRGGILDRQSDLMSRVRRNIITSGVSHK